MAGWEPGLKSGKGKTDQQMRVGSPSPGSQPSAFGFILLQPLFGPGAPSSLARITVTLAHDIVMDRPPWPGRAEVATTKCQDHRDSGTLRPPWPGSP